MKHIFSTLSADVRYTDTDKAPGGMNRVRRSVLVRGGSGVALQGAGQQVLTPAGIRTQVSDEDAAFLETHPIYQLHKQNGFIRVENRASDPEVVADKMESGDPSKPKTPADVKKDADTEAARTGLSPEESLQVVTNKKK